jgi:general secretion pathway protein I
MSVRGFTLIEVLAALIIVSLGMMAVIQAVSQTASNSTYLHDKTIAHWVAMNRLTEARLDPSAPKVDESSDDVEMASREWTWTMNVTQTPVETMRRIDITVRPSEAEEGTSMAAVTGFYGSAIAPPGKAMVLWEGVPKQGPRNPGDRDEDDRDGDGDGDNNEEPPPLEPPEDADQPEMPEPTPGEDLINPPEEDPSL